MNADIAVALLCIVVFGPPMALAIGLGHNYKAYVEHDIEIDTVCLTMAHGLAESTAAHGEISFVVDDYVHVSVGGGVEGVDLKGMRNGTLFVYSYDGPMTLKEPASVGDNVTVAVRAGGGEVEAPVDIVMDSSQCAEFGMDPPTARHNIMLTEFAPGTESVIIHGKIAIVVGGDAGVGLGGDLLNVNLIDIDEVQIIRHDGGKTVYYEGPLTLKEPVSVGDEVSVVIRHGDSETTAVVEVKPWTQTGRS